jgi:hypothetical protein
MVCITFLFSPFHPVSLFSWGSFFQIGFSCHKYEWWITHSSTIAMWFLEALASLDLGIPVSQSVSQSHFWSVVPWKTLQDPPGTHGQGKARSCLNYRVFRGNWEKVLVYWKGQEAFLGLLSGGEVYWCSDILIFYGHNQYKWFSK